MASYPSINAVVPDIGNCFEEFTVALATSQQLAIRNDQRSKKVLRSRSRS